MAQRRNRLAGPRVVLLAMELAETGGHGERVALPAVDRDRSHLARAVGGVGRDPAPDAQPEARTRLRTNRALRRLPASVTQAVEQYPCRSPGRGTMQIPHVRPGRE